MVVPNRQWLALTTEEPVDPHRRIVDAHHHVIPAEDPRGPYLLEDFLADAGAGHNVTHSVYCETSTRFREDGPKELRPVGETEWAAENALRSDRSATRIAGIVGFANVTLGDAIDEVLDAHEAAGAGRFRGVRHPVAYDPSPAVPSWTTPGWAPPRAGLMAEVEFRRGVARVGARGYTFDVWVYSPQLVELAALARAVEGTTIVIDHLGVPLEVGPYSARATSREQWREGMRACAACPNVVVKVGGLGMDGYVFDSGFSSREKPPSSDDIVAYWGDDVRWVIHTFGPSRCMFESDFPVDAMSFGYTAVWNAFQKMSGGYSDHEQDQLFSGTAARVYRIGLAS